jgi:hypothetical protein
MAMNSGNNAEVVKTSLDEVLYTEYDREQEPGEILATDGLFFKQESTGMGAVQYAEYQGPGEFEVHAEEESRKLATVQTANKTTASVLNYKNTVYIPDEFYQDDQHSEVAHTASMFGMRARTSRDKHAFARTYAGGFATTIPTPDGAALFSATHTALDGSTVDNLDTGTLTPANLETVVRNLRLQNAQDGELGGHNAAGLLTPVVLFPDAMEITKSALAANSAENNLNYFSEVYPGMVVGASAYLDSANNTATNADTSYYVVSRNHRISRTVRQAIKTTLVSPDTDIQDRWTYKAGFREVAIAKTWEGVQASDGTV